MKLGSMKRRIAVIGGVAAAIVLAGAGIASAVVTGYSGGPVGRVTVATNDTAAVYTGAVWQTIASTSVATSGANGFIVARYTAESACYGGSGWCSVRILIGGVEAQPASGTDFAFDSTDAGAASASSWESHAVERVLRLPSAGAHTVQVQVAQVGAGVTARYDDSLLRADAIG